MSNIFPNLKPKRESSKNLLSSALNKARGELEAHLKPGMWREKPVDVKSFVMNDYYLGIKNEKTGQPLSPTKKQLELLYAIFPTDPEEGLFNSNDYTEFVAMWGKGSGKDFISVVAMMYLLYKLLCLKDPYQYLGFTAGEPIDMINVATNEKQALRVYFEKVKQRVNQSPWFQEKIKEYGKKRFTINTGFIEIKLPRGLIRVVSAHSQNDSYEGYNLIFAVMDEAAAFKSHTQAANADAVYGTLKSSMTSRFGKNIALLIISYPRHDGDFIMKKHAEAIKEEIKDVYASKGKTWEINPNAKKEDFQDDYMHDPETAKAKYECEPPKQEDSLFKMPEKIRECVNLDRGPVAAYETKHTERIINSEIKKFISIELFGIKGNKNRRYYIHGDPGKNGDDFALAMGHGEPRTIIENGENKLFNFPVIDLLLRWRPDKKNGYPVDFRNVQKIIEMLADNFKVKKVQFDQWNSADKVQELMDYGVDAEDKAFSNSYQLRIYRQLKGVIYNNAIDLLHETCEKNYIEGLENMKLLNGDKITHDEQYDKDGCDAVAAVVDLILSEEPDPLEGVNPAVLNALAGTSIYNYKI